MATLALKLALTPLLIVGASLAGRRWGHAVSGWLIALPLTSGPVSAFLVAEHGSRFAARGAVGSLSGIPGEAVFLVVWAWTARRGWPAALTAATLAFAGVGAIVQALPLSALPADLVATYAAGLAVLAAALLLLPRGAKAAVPVGVEPPRWNLPRWDLPARAVAATVLVVVLTESATVVGARLVGLLAVFPLYATVLAVFAQLHAGRAATLPLFRGTLVGLTSFASFFLVLGLLLTRIPPVGAFACATAAALAVQAATLGTLRGDQSEPTNARASAR